MAISTQSARYHGWKAEVSATARLSVPLILAQLTQVAIHTTDVVMLGWLGPRDLAAAALAVNLYFLFGFAGTGLVSACAPLIASALGRRSNAVREVRRNLRSALHLCLLFAVPVILILAFSEQLMLAFGQDPQLSSAAASYVAIAQWTIAPHLIIIVLRIFLTTLDKAHIPLIVTVGGLVANALLNWMLIFGNWGAPALGLEGAAIATLLTNGAMAAALILVVAYNRRTRRFHAFGRFWRPDFHKLWALTTLGAPIALTMAFEISVFSAAVYLMGWIDTDSVAAHAIALQIAAITFMVPLGISQATVIRVGLAHGAGDRGRIGLAGWSSLGLALAFMSLSALAMWLFPSELAGLFLDTSDPRSERVLQLAVQFLAVAALFQLFDGGQVVGAAMLRGLQDTRIPMLFALVGYWLVGLGSGYVLAFRFGLQGTGIWIGLALGLGTVAVLMIARWSMRDRLGLGSDRPRPDKKVAAAAY